MARILYAWELGWQLSHLSNISMLARSLASEGHEIAVAARELHDAHRFFAGTRVHYYQAPFKQGPGPKLDSYQSYAHLLYTSGYQDPRELAVLVSAWFGILQSFRPDLVVCDHAPTALLASRALGARTAVIGSGFLIPPAHNGEPLGVLPDVPRSEEVIARLARDEAAVLGVVNEAAGACGIDPLERLGDLYEDADAQLLLSFEELDPFPEREQPVYYGVWRPLEAAKPDWPPGDHRVFGYLSPFPGHQDLVAALRDCEASVLLFAPAIDRATREKLSTARLRFCDDLADLDEVARSCDVFVSHGAHSSVARTLLGGVPQMMLPLYREQSFTARNVEALGAGRVCEPGSAGCIEALLNLLGDDAFRRGAQSFAAAHADHDDRSASEAAAARLRDLI